MRKNDWEARLTAYITGMSKSQFEWGVCDCALFTAGAVEALTGADPAAPYRGSYSTAAGAARAIRKAGHKDHIGFVAAHYPPVSRPDLLPGDLAVLPTDDGPALGVVQGEMVYVMAQSGLGLVPLENATQFYGVR